MAGPERDAVVIVANMVEAVLAGGVADDSSPSLLPFFLQPLDSLAMQASSEQRRGPSK